jgi:hypothetical protein
MVITSPALCGCDCFGRCVGGDVEEEGKYAGKYEKGRERE